MKLWTIQKIAKALRVSDSTVRRAIRGLEIQRVNGTPKLRHSVLVEWLGFDPSERLWTIQEIAKWSGYSIPTIERTISNGTLGSVTLGARTRRVRNSQLVAWLGFDPAAEDGYKPRPRLQPQREESAEPRLFEM
jgi:excisionase family DNA binding protein